MQEKLENELENGSELFVEIVLTRFPLRFPLPGWQFGRWRVKHRPPKSREKPSGDS
jgi:hypothetical protein